MVDAPRLQTESGQIATTSPTAPSHSAWSSAHLGIASVSQGSKQFIALNVERAYSARQAEAKQQQQQQQEQHVDEVNTFMC